MLLGQIELLLEQLATSGGGWGVMAAMLWIGWRVWKEVKPHLTESLVLRGREVAAREKQAVAQGRTAEATEQMDKSVEGLRTSVDNLAKGMNNGFAKITDRILPRRPNGE